MILLYSVCLLFIKQFSPEISFYDTSHQVCCSLYSKKDHFISMICPLSSRHLSVEPNLFRSRSLLHVWKDSPPFTAKWDIFRYFIEGSSARFVVFFLKKIPITLYFENISENHLTLDLYAYVFRVRLFCSLSRRSAVKLIYLIALDVANPKLAPSVVSFLRNYAFVVFRKAVVGCDNMFWKNWKASVK